MADIVCSTFANTNFKALNVGMPMVVIYEKPVDYPDKYVARLWDVKGPTRRIVLADTLIEARKAIPFGMVKFDRFRNDDPCVTETWI